MTWLKNITGRRLAQSPSHPEATTQSQGVLKRLEVDNDEFAGVLIGAKVLKEYGASFKPALADMAEVADFAGRMEPHRASQFERAVEAYYAKVAESLFRIPPVDRNEAVEASVKALRALIEEVPHDDLVGAAITSMTDLVGHAARFVPAQKSLSAGAVRRAASAAKDALTTLVHALEGRGSAAAAFNVYPNIVWQVEQVAQKPEQERFQRWNAIAELVADALPKSRIDQIAVAELGAAVATELAKTPNDDRGALERAKALVFDAASAALQSARQQAQDAPPNVLHGSDSGIAYEAVRSAIVAVLDANRAGPGSLGAAAESMLARIAEYAPLAGPAQRAAWCQIGELLRRVAPTPTAEAILRYLAANAELLVDSAPARFELAHVPSANAASLPTILIRAQLAKLGLEADGFLGRLSEFDPLPASVKMQVALAALPHVHDMRVAPGIIDVLADFAKHASASGQEMLETFAANFARSYPELLNRLGDPRAAPAAAAIARANQCEVIDPAKVQAIAEICLSIASVMPDAPFGALMADDAERRPGLMTLSNGAVHRFDPKQFLAPLFQTIALLEASPDSKLELMRRAMHLSREIAELDRDPLAVFNKAFQDWNTALQDPDALHFAIRSGSSAQVRAQGSRRGGSQVHGAVRFLREHPELPPEIAFTAGVSLTSDQLGWLTTLLATQRSRARIRGVRDALFAIGEANRPDLLDVLRTSKSPSSAVTGALQFVAREYRAGAAHEIPWEVIANGLRQGEDPALAIEKERVGFALAQLNLQEIGAERLDPGGVQLLAKVAADIQGLLSGMPPGREVYGVPTARLRDHFVAILRAVADGSWPKMRYESEIGQRQLEGLTPKQRAIWMEEWVTPLRAPAVPPVEESPELERAISLLKGLAQGLRKEARIGVPGLAPLAFDAASRDLLRAEVDRILAILHGEDKGSAAHRMASRKIGAMTANLSVIELALALDGLNGQVLDRAAAIDALKPLLIAGKPAVRKLHARGSLEAIERVLELAPEAKPQTARSGVYAVDEDRLDAFMTSFDAGCMAPRGSGGNRAGLVGHIADAQYKICRTMNGEAGMTRSLLRLYHVEMPNYKGYAIWMDGPYPTNRNGPPSTEMYRLAYKHALRKAMAMGIPFMYGPVGYGAGKNEGAAAMQEAGVVSHAMHVAVTLDMGVAGLHHCQSIFGDRLYFVSSADRRTGYQSGPKGQAIFQASLACNVVKPRRLGLEDDHAS
jgi:hypothetical protein